VACSPLDDAPSARSPAGPEPAASPVDAFLTTWNVDIEAISVAAGQGEDLFALTTRDDVCRARTNDGQMRDVELEPEPTAQDVSVEGDVLSLVGDDVALVPGWVEFDDLREPNDYTPGALRFGLSGV